MLMGVSWLKEAKAKVLVGEGFNEVSEERLIYNFWPEPASFIAEEGI